MFGQPPLYTLALWKPSKHKPKLSALLEESLHGLSRIAKLSAIDLKGTIMSLDAGYDSLANRKLIFNRGMIPNIKENPRNRKKPKRGRKRIYSDIIFKDYTLVTEPVS